MGCNAKWTVDEVYTNDNLAWYWFFKNNQLQAGTQDAIYPEHFTGRLFCLAMKRQKGHSTMKRYLVLALAALALAIAAPSAFATRVIFDPPVSSTPCTQNTPCNIGALNQPYTVEFLSCSQVLGVTPPAGSEWCLWLNNVTLHTASKFTFQFSVPDGGSNSGDQLECSSIPSGFATNNCPQDLPDVGQQFTVSFFVDPPLPNRTDFYLFTDFLTSPGTATVTVSVPEPGALGLFGLGLLALGVGFGWQKRRQPVRGQ